MPLDQVTADLGAQQRENLHKASPPVCSLEKGYTQYLFLRAFREQGSGVSSFDGGTGYTTEKEP